MKSSINNTKESLSFHNSVFPSPIEIPDLSFLCYIFYIDNFMPCCGKPVRFFNGPRGGDAINIKCFHCGQKWNICIPFFIEKI